MPSVVAVGTVATSTAAITPALPAGVVQDDILITVAECEGTITPGAYTLPTGWAHVTGSPVQEGTNTRLWVIWKRFNTGDTAPSLGDSGDHNIGRMIAIRGCPTTGNPWDVVGAATSATSSTAVTMPGATTTVPLTLILEIIATGADIATAQFSTVTNGNYTSITSRINDWTTNGNGGGIGVVSASKATAGATGQSTATLVTAATKAMMTLALRDATAGGAVAAALTMRSPRPAEQNQAYGNYAAVNPSTIIGG